jgi:hypothetical protein
MIKPNTLFKVKDRLCYSKTEIYISEIPNKKSLIVVDLTTNTDYPDINALPVLQVFYETLEEKYILKNNFVILGETKDICLI